MADSTLAEQWLLECHEVGHLLNISSTHESFGCEPVNSFFSCHFCLVVEKPGLKLNERITIQNYTKKLHQEEVFEDIGLKSRIM